MAELTYITDLVTRGQARIPGHLREGDDFQKLVELLIVPLQEIEDDLWDIAKQTLLDGSGAQLDQVGEILSIDRMVGESDTDYKLRLQGFASELASSGEPEIVIQAYILLWAATKVYLTEYDPASIALDAVIEAGEDDSSTDAEKIAAMNQTIAAGIGAMYSVVESNEFLWGSVDDVDGSGDLPDDADHGWGTEADADGSGNITPGAGKGGNFARAIT